MNKLKLTSIAISENDKKRLFGCAVKLKELSGDNEILDPFEIVSIATSTLEDWIKAHDKKLTSTKIN